jgi:hypothetical protein
MAQVFTCEILSLPNEYLPGVQARHLPNRDELFCGMTTNLVDAANTAMTVSTNMRYEYHE